MLAVKLLVKIAVMMMAPGGTPVPPEAKGRGGPFVFFFLDLLPRWEKGLPSGPWSPWRGRGESPSEIGSISLSLSVPAFSSGSVSPFRIYMEIHNSDWTETFAVILYQKIAFLRPKKGINRLTGGLQESRARPGGGHAPLSRGHPGHCFALILLPKNHKYSKKNLRRFLSRLDSV